MGAKQLGSNGAKHVRSNNAGMNESHTPKMDKMPELSDPKSPAAVVTGARIKKMPAFPTWGAPVQGQRTRKMPSLSDPKSANKDYNGGT